MKSIIIGLLISVIIVSPSFAQQKQNWIDGELLVRLKADDVLKSSDLVQRIEKQFSSISLSNAKLISKDLNIWKFDYDVSKMDIDKAIATVYLSNAVVTVQRNHIIKYRETTPNDPDFGQQWQYIQANNKDIDADLAWDVTTGGFTALGDTIVVCVIDDGIGLTHPDLIDNLWENKHEIPGNNIDDDGNGYTDDVRGWNAYENNDNVAHGSFEGHGSPVAGIIGAKGNNGIGVAGVNWNVKLMIVKGGGNESDAITAYSYALSNRKLYNSTNGAKGAFVVATNASWGVDGGQASDAPLWCAMYDTLGAHGVLNTGATANANVNVDIDGDLPTQCPSEYLITVTNTNQSDVKVTSAGYGAVSIDLGAPGEGTHTIDGWNMGGYDAFGGTSGATPHVTGTIALLYAVPCLNLSNLAKTDPAAAARLVKDYILNGVDSNSSLNGITETGGRLNVNNAVQALVSGCTPVGLEFEDALESALTIYPNPLQNNTVNLRYSSNVYSDGEIIIYAISGKVVHQEKIQIIAGENVLQIKLKEKLARGIYHLEFKTNAESSYKKLVK
jgi:subtilisin family serine protease